MESRYRWSRFLALLGISLLAFGPKQVTAQPVDYVIQISVDGLHAGELQTLMQTRPAEMDHFWRFVREGTSTFNARTDVSNTETLPNHISMMTGRPVSQPGDDPLLHHGYTSNTDPLPTATIHDRRRPVIDYIESAFDVAHDHGLTTSLYSGKSKFSIFDQSYNASSSASGGRPDQFLDDGDHGADKIDRFLMRSLDGTSSEVIAQWKADTAVAPANLTLIHLLEPDAVGHQSGWRVNAWDRSVELVNVHLGQIFETVEAHPLMAGRTTIVLTSDHGGFGVHHSDTVDANNYTIPFFAWGNNVAAGDDLYQLNRWTRADPGLEQIPYTNPSQPVRNGDAANLILDLLGLNAIDGSSINQQQDLLLGYAGDATWWGTLAGSGQPGDGGNWSDPANWQRAGQHDRLAKPNDNVVFLETDAPQTVAIGARQVVQTLTFQGDYDFGDGEFQITAGQMHVDQERTVAVGGIFSDRGTLVTGGGTLWINQQADSLHLLWGTVVGSFDCTGSLVNNDRMVVDDIDGVIHVARDYTQNSRGTLTISIGRQDDEATSGRLSVGDVAILRNTLSILPDADYVDPDIAGSFDRFELLDAFRTVGRFHRIEYAHEGLSLAPVSDQELRAHVGMGLFRSVLYGTGSVSLINYRAVEGDANGDGQFNSTDLIDVFIAGEYEDQIPGNSDWTRGDWNHDDDFNSSDMVTAFLAGHFEQPSVFEESPSAAVPEPSTLMLFVIALVLWRISAGTR